MGMAASQARLLSITSRLSDNEFSAQSIMRTKMQNSTETGKLSENYRRSLDATKMVGQAFTPENGQMNLDLSYGLVAGNANIPLGTQYVVTNAQGEILVSKSMGSKYKNATKDLDMTNPDDYAKGFSGFIALMGITKSEPIEPKMPACMTDPDGEYQMSLAASKKWGEANQELLSEQRNFKDATRNLHPVKTNYTADEAGEDRVEILLSNPDRAAKIMAFAKKGTGTGEAIGETYTTISYGDKSFGYQVPSMAGEFNVYRWDPALSDEENMEGYLAAVFASVNEGRADAGGYTDNTVREWGNTGYDVAINNFFNPQAITNLPVYDKNGNNITGSCIDIDGMKYTPDEAKIYKDAKKKLDAATAKEAAARRDMEAKEAAWKAVAPRYEAEINEYNKKQTEYLDKYEAFCRDKYSVYSDPKQAQYYEQLYMQIATRGALEVPDEQLNDKNWFQFAMKSGQIFLEKCRQDGTWEPCHWKTEPGIMEVADTDKAGSIKSKYEIDLDKLQRKEDALDMQLKNIETEHNALQTEFDGVKAVIQKNVERSFKTLG